MSEAFKVGDDVVLSETMKVVMVSKDGVTCEWQGRMWTFPAALLKRKLSQPRRRLAEFKSRY